MKLVAVATVAALVLAGCSGGGGTPLTGIDDVPDEINRQKLDDVEAELVSKFPRRFSFPGQQLLDAVQVFFNDTVSAGQGSASIELPRDVGICTPSPAPTVCTGSDVNPTYIRYDVSEHVPVGQPVEMRIKLKWWGNPGSAADLDIFVDVPGNRGAHDPDSFDESNNWNIVTKFLVVNTVRLDGRPFDVGVQVTNGRVLAEEMPYSLRVDFAFAADVLAPGVAYGVTVPQNASRLVFESEPLLGDEHITGDFLVIDPSDRLLRHMPYDDIGVDARVVSTPNPGEYVLYAPTLRGGFLKVFTDVPNEGFQARILTMEEHSSVLAQSVLPPTGESGQFGIEAFPLEMHAWIRPTGSVPVGVAGQAALNLTSESGWVTTSSVTASAWGESAGRIGNRLATISDYGNLKAGGYGWTVEGSVAAAMDAGYRYVTYVR